MESIYKYGAIVLIPKSTMKVLHGSFDPEKRIKNYYYVHYSEYKSLCSANPSLPVYADLPEWWNKK
jgi:hypothetical protein